MTTVQRLPGERSKLLPSILVMGSDSYPRVTLPCFRLRLRLAYGEDNTPATEQL